MREVVAELVSDPGRLRELESGWRALAVERSNAFVTPEWFWAWHSHYGSGQHPLVGVVHAPAGELRGVLPLVSEGAGRLETARFAGSSLGDHFHPVASTSDEAAVAGAVGAALRALSGPKLTLVLENIDVDADWWRELSLSAGHRSEPLVGRRTTLPNVRLAGRSWDDYLATRSRNLRSQLGRKRRALERKHELSLRWTRPGDDVRGDMATLFRLHDMRWASRPQASSLTSERARAFHTDFAEAAARQGWLRLAFLEIGAVAVAGWYGWRVGDRFAYYQAGFDPAWRASSVGLVLFAETLRAAAEEGASDYDTLLGQEDFKLRFADAGRLVCTSVIGPRLRPARVLAAAEMRVRRAGRRLPESIRDRAERSTRALRERLPLARRR